MTEESKITNPRLVVVIVVPYYWGKGKTVADAWKRVKQESGKTLRELKAGPYRVNVVPETDEFPAYVNQMGSLNWADVEGIRNLVIDERD